MGVETRKSYLPAPTDSPVEQTAGDSSTELDLATEVSRQTDKTSWTIPEDGREITIPAKTRKEKRGDEAKASKSSSSQTSLLIEYFEGGKVQARPSVRVKVTPSAARKIKSENEHITLSESVGGRKPSYTRRISLGRQSPSTKRITDSPDDRSISSYASAAEDSTLSYSRPPIEIEVMHRDQDSDLSRQSDDRQLLVNPSEISSMPADSMLEEKQSSSLNTKTRPKTSSTAGRDAVVVVKDSLKAPERTRSRSISKERLAQKAAEKIAARSRENASGRRRRSGHSSRSRSVSNEHSETLSSSRRRSSKGHAHEETIKPGKDSSIVSDSQVSSQVSGDQYSIRSAASRSSNITNPKLLETVENAIKRFVMPELEKLKEEQRAQKSKTGLDHRTSTSEGSFEQTPPKASRHRTTEETPTRPKVVLNQGEHEPGTILSGDSIKGRKERRASRKSDSPRERRSEREMSEETVVYDPQSASKKKSKDGHSLRGSSSGLTAAALQRHDLKQSDSRSTMDSRERRRRRRSKSSHSRGTSVQETEDAFAKQNVPPMPFTSDVHSSDVTRDSILSFDTEGSKSPAVEVQKATIRQLARASPREISSPGTRTPTKTSLQKGLGTHHSNNSQGNLSPRSPDTAGLREEKPSIFGGDRARQFLPSPLRSHEIGNAYEDTYQEGRALSPIQSVSSRQESEVQRNRMSATSLKSETSLASAAFDRTNRPRGINLESRDEIIEQLRESELLDDNDEGVDEWLRREHERNDELRSSIDGPIVDYRHMTNFTDDSMDSPYLDQIAEGQKHKDVDARKDLDYRSTPVAVESAVASLLDTSVISSRKGVDRSFIDSPDKRESGISASQEVRSKGSKGSARSIDRQLSQKSFLHDTSAKGSPRQSLVQSEASEPVPMGASGVPLADDPMPDIEALREDSDISTNPSFLHGPMAGTPHGNRDHWPYDPTPDQQYPDDSKRSSAEHSLKARAAELLAAAQLAQLASPDNKPRSRDWSVKDGLQPKVEDAEYEPVDSKLDPTISKDPVAALQGLGLPLGEAPISDLGDSDPFVGNTKHERHLSTNSGLARGMGSPTYDSATGSGKDRIQSKDIVALMDHLTVRDAHRNARDTEIIVTLVRSAAEMRQSFEQMKQFIAEQDDIMVELGNRQHDRTQKILGGPRPPPPSFAKRPTAPAMDSSAKKQNVFRRALKGMSRNNQNDVGRIEEMMEHLLAEVESLKSAQTPQYQSRPLSSAKSLSAKSLDSYEQMRATDPEDYAEPNVRSPLTSRDHPQYYPSPTGRGPSAMQPMLDRQASGTRVSTVLEADEELSEQEEHVLANQFENNEQLLTPTKDRPFLDPQNDYLATPPQARLAAAAASTQTPTTNPPLKSVENTPDEKSRKHKSNSSSIFPKISRWSRSTATSRNSGAPVQTPKPHTDDDFAGDGRPQEYLNYPAPPAAGSPNNDRLRYDYDEDDDRLPQTDNDIVTSRHNDAADLRPPSPLVPSAVSEEPHAHSYRDSMNLQHPQPRQGPTHRYQTHLENEARAYAPTGSNRTSTTARTSRASPAFSPDTDTFGSDPALSRWSRVGAPGGATSNRNSRALEGIGASGRYSYHAGHLTPISGGDAASIKSASEEVAQGPPRPPKVKEGDEPLVPRDGTPDLRVLDTGAGAGSGGSGKKARFLTPDGEAERGDGDERRWSGASASEEATSSRQQQQQQSGRLAAPLARATQARKPSGPRPMSTGSGSKTATPPTAGAGVVVARGTGAAEGIEGIQRRRYRGSPNAIALDSDEDEEEGDGTF